MFQDQCLNFYFFKLPVPVILMTAFHCLGADLQTIQTYSTDYHHKCYLRGLKVELEFLIYFIYVA